MKKWSMSIAAVLIATWLVVRDAKDAVQYFSGEPHQLLYVAAIGVAGGFAALVLARFSCQAQHRIRLLAWGAGARVSLVLLLCTVVAAYLWVLPRMEDRPLPASSMNVERTFMSCFMEIFLILVLRFVL